MTFFYNISNKGSTNQVETWLRSVGYNIADAPFATFWGRADDEPDGTSALWTNKIIGGVASPTQPTVGNRPVITANQFNSRKALIFTGANSHYMTFGTNLGKPASYYIIIVAMTTNGANNQNFCGSIDSGADSSKAWGRMLISNLYPNRMAYIYGAGSGSLYSYGYATSANITNGIYDIFVHRYIDTSSYALTYKQNLLQPTTTIASNALSTAGTAYEFAIGRSGAYNGNYLTGGIAEMIIGNGVISDENLLNIINELKRYYGN